MADISGIWRGHYEQAGGRHGIAMQVVQRGESFVGRMRDDDTLISGAVTVHAEGHVDARGQPLVLEAETLGSLPEHSVVEGEVHGDFVEFDKRYLGVHRISSWIGGREFHHELADHRVRYAGRLDADGAVLRGRWSLHGCPPDGPGCSGAFELRRP